MRCKMDEKDLYERPLKSQCIFDGVDLSRYPIGVLAARLGALSGGDKTVETLTVRLMQALKVCKGAEEIREFMERPV